MKKGKKIIVVIIILLLLLLIVGGAFAYVYVATDIFRTDKEMFLTYFAQLTSEEGFLDKRINEFYEKKTQNAYENSGEITVDAKYPDEDFDKVMNKVNDLAIRFSGKVDSLNQKVEQNIEVDYGDDVTLPINYRQDGNKFGLQTDELSKKYIAVRNEDLQQLVTNLGIEDAEIPAVFDLTEETKDINITDAEIEQLKQIYTPILQENLTEENFSSIKTEQNESYTLELNNEQIKNLVIKMLEATKQNTLIIDKINEIMLTLDPDAEKIDVSVIDDIIEDINGEDIADIPNLKVTLVQSNKVLNQIIIQLGESTISIKKSIATDVLSYNINCDVSETMNSTIEANSLFADETSEPGQANAFVNIQYKGLDTLTNVQENYEFGFDITNSGETMKYVYGINTNTKFYDIVSIDELDNSVAIFLNDYDETQLTPFLTQVGDRLAAINKTQMEELGLEEYENPLLFSTPVTILGLIVYNMAAETVDSVEAFASYEISAFNEKFTPYVGEEVRGSEVNAMIKTVQNNSLSSAGTEGHWVKVTLDGAEISENVDSTKTYNIEAVYDTEGYVIEMQVTTNN